MIHRVSVYTDAGVLAHVQSTNGPEWPNAVRAFDSSFVEIPLVRIDVEVEATAREVTDSTNGQPAPRKASRLFREQLEVVGGRVRYRPGEGDGGRISDRAIVVAPI